MIICHGDLGKHFINAATIIYQKPIENISTLAIVNSLSLAKINFRFHTTINKLSKKTRSIIILCDAFGTTASRIVTQQSTENFDSLCVYGLNLPMLLDCINYRDSCTLEQLAKQLCHTGQEAIFAKNLGSDVS